jgi:GcrA cell cycle regulator
MGLPDEHIAVIQRLTNEGHTALVIAQLASVELGRPVTRNAICGMWSRGRVAKTDAQLQRRWGCGVRDGSTEKRIQARQERRAAKKEERETRRRSAVPLVAVKNPPPTIDDLMIPAEQRRTLMQLTLQTCKWPVGEPGQPDFFFCGAESTRGSSYCAGHHFRSTNYAAPEPFRRKVNFLAEAAE